MWRLSSAITLQMREATLDWQQFASVSFTLVTAASRQPRCLKLKLTSSKYESNKSHVFIGPNLRPRPLHTSAPSRTLALILADWLLAPPQRLQTGNRDASGEASVGAQVKLVGTDPPEVRRDSDLFRHFNNSKMFGGFPLTKEDGETSGSGLNWPNWESSQAVSSV